MDIGVAVIDAYTHHVLNYLETVNKTSEQTLQDLVSLKVWKLAGQSDTT